MSRKSSAVFLRACPFCASDMVELQGMRGCYWVVCHKCLSFTGNRKKKFLAVNLWNGGEAPRAADMVVE